MLHMTGSNGSRTGKKTSPVKKEDRGGNIEKDKSPIIPKEEEEYLKAFHEYQLVLDVAKHERREIGRKVKNAQDRFASKQKKYKEWKNAK